MFFLSLSLTQSHYKLSPSLPKRFIQFSISAAFWFECFTIDDIFFDLSLAHTEEKKWMALSDIGGKDKAYKQQAYCGLVDPIE